MADDQTQRPFRASGSAERSSATDPLAELARLIGQTDPFAEFGRGNARQPAAPAVQPAAQQPAAAEWSTPAGHVPGYAPHAAEPPHADPYQAQHYAGPDLDHTEGGEAAYAQHPGEPGYAPYDEPGQPPYGPEDEDYFEDAQPRRRLGVLAIAAVFALAVIGTAGAFGYRALFGTSFSGPPPVIKADSAPTKVVPPKDDSNIKLIQERVPPQNEKLVTREEKPVDIQDKPAGVFPPSQMNAASGTVQAPMMGSGVIGGEPKKIHTITIRPDQAGAGNMAGPTAPSPSDITAIKSAPSPEPRHVANTAPPRQDAAPAARHSAPPPRHTVARAEPQHREAPPSRNAPLSLSPNAEPAEAAPSRSAPMRTAAVSPRQSAPQTARSGGYAVQLSSRHNQSDAEAAFRSLQSKFPTELGGRRALIRRVDLGQKGVYYRAMVGPFASSDEASKLCSRLKAAGGSCFVQRI